MVKATISRFLDAARSGRIDEQSFFRAIHQFFSLVIIESETARNALARHYEIGTDYNVDLSSAVRQLNSFLSQMKEGVRPSWFLSTEIEYAESATDTPQEFDPSWSRGIGALVDIFSRAPTKNPLQRWADVLCVANFTWPVSERSSVILKPDENDIGADLPSAPGSVVPSLPENRHISLGLALDLAYGVQEECREDATMPGYKRALGHWSNMLRLLLSDAENDVAFRTTLCEPQSKSLGLLLEWWNGNLDDEASSTISFDVLEAAAQDGLLSVAFLPRKFLRIAFATREEKDTLDEEYVRQQILYGPHGPPYHWTMFRLFQVEFLPDNYQSKPGGSLVVLHSTRKMALRIASSQRSAMACYRWMLSTSKNTESPVDESRDTCSAQLARAGRESRIHLPLLQSSSPGVSTRATDNLPSTKTTEELYFTRFKHSDFSPTEWRELEKRCNIGRNCRLSASLSVCDWLDAEVSKPYYLWDTIQKRTVKTEDLSEPIEYTAVSHTWGRWRKEGPGVTVPGVREWLVPENSKFEVMELPCILSTTPFKTRFIWFDLVCIPQNPQTEALRRRSQEEIGRQAVIFRNARYAVAWFNEITRWEGMQAALQRYSVSFLQEPDGLGLMMPATIMEKIEQDAKLHVELFDTTSVSRLTSKNQEDSMNPWYSSLWTLQELCLRPDMLLCAQNWTLLGFGEEVENAISFEQLVALSEGGKFTKATSWTTEEESKHRCATNYITPQSTGTIEIAELLDLSGIEHLLNISRTTILGLGNQRYCENYRAEAIMAAIGVQDWYLARDTLSLNRDDEREAKDRYPVAFLREAASKLGAEFFGAIPGEGELLENLMPHLNQDGQRNAIGTMLPFTSSLLSMGPSPAESYTGPDFPAVSSWTIQADMSVKILKAGILSYTGQEREPVRYIGCTILGPGLDEPPSLIVQRHLDVNLDHWIDTFVPTTRNYAVCLHRRDGGHIADGVLLKELSCGDLIKVGTYCVTTVKTTREIDPPTLEVDWRVL